MAFQDPAFIEFYEQIDGNRTVDIEFYKEIARSGHGPVLEAGCGSGRVLLPLLRDGIDIAGFDPSQAMLDLLLERAGDQTPNVWKGDFSEMRGGYSTIISPFNTILHMLTQEEQITAFRNVYNALDAGGVFVFDIVNPFNLDIYNERRVFETSMVDLKTEQNVEVWRRFEYDHVSQRAKYHREFIVERRTLQSVIEFRWSYPSEISLLLKMSDFSTFDVFGDFQGGALRADSESQIWVAWK
jgi:SAM-dependent methyltransferase